MKKNYFLILVIFFTVAIQSQDINNKWVIGVGAGGALYSEADSPTIGYRYSEQFPRISFATYLFKNVSFAGAFSTSIDSTTKYTTVDGEVRYDFGTSENRFSPYVLIGGSLVDQKHLLPVINFGAGGTFWISDSFGLNGQLMYKINHLDYQSQGTHIYASGNLVYRFSLGGGGSRRAGNRRRLWERKH